MKTDISIKNKEIVKKLEKLLNLKIVEYGDMFVDIISSAYFLPYMSLSEFIEKNGNDVDNNYFEKIINWMKISSIKSDFEANCIKTADFLIGLYDALIDEGVDNYNDDSLKKYYLSEDHKVLEKNKIIAIIKQNINPFIVELNELNLIQNKLLSLFPKINELYRNKDKTDWGSLAKSFGSGALAVINPFIGIPAVIANYSHENMKKQSNEQIVEEFGKMLDKYYDQIEKIREIYVPILEKQKETLKNKIQKDFVISYLKYCDVLNNKGYDLNIILENVKKAFDELEKEFNAS